MPGIDPKNIPTLEDIIEKATAEESSVATPVTDGDVTLAETEAFDIARFLAEAGPIAENAPLRDAGPELGDMDDIVIMAPDDADSFLFDDAEVELFNETEIDFTEYFNDSGDDDDYDSVTVADDENTATPALEPIQVGPLVKDIVKQMLPDIEQQLVFMLQKAIEEKLPKELIKPAAGSKNDED